MCRKRLSDKPCWNYKCPHNLFSEGLKLNVNKIHITKKAREIGNCCCLIHDRWTSGEIANAWGLTEQRVKQSEASAWRKVQGQNSCRQLRKVMVS